MAASTLHEDAVVVDTHNDLLGLVVRRPRAEQAAYFRSQWLPQLRAGGVDVQVLSAYSGGNDLTEIVNTIEAGHRVAEANSDVVAICLTGAEIDAALAEGKIALVLSVEGCGALRSEVGLLETMFRLGVRMVSFTHMGRTGFADGSAEDATGSGLTRVGVEALALFEELGVLMDVSHLSASGVDDVLERARRPVIASHSSAFSLLQHHRNLTDERLKDHVMHIASVAGIDHVGLGPDFIEEYAMETYVGDLVLEGVSLKQTIPGLGGPRGLPLVTDALVSRGVPENQIRAILGENWLRVFRSEIGVPLSARPG
jgi:membrane dipeptidase